MTEHTGSNTVIPFTIPSEVGDTDPVSVSASATDADTADASVTTVDPETVEIDATATDADVASAPVTAAESGVTPISATGSDADTAGISLDHAHTVTAGATDADSATALVSGNVHIAPPSATAHATGVLPVVRARSLARHTTSRVGAGAVADVDGATLARHTPSHL